MKKKTTKREQFDKAVEAIYTDSSLSLVEALHKYDKFFYAQDFPEKPPHDFVKFTAYKILADYLAKDLKPKSWAEYKQKFINEIAFRDTQIFNYKPFAYPSLSIYIGAAQWEKLKKRFAELTT